MQSSEAKFKKIAFRLSDRDCIKNGSLRLTYAGLKWCTRLYSICMMKIKRDQRKIVNFHLFTKLATVRTLRDFSFYLTETVLFFGKKLWVIQRTGYLHETYLPTWNRARHGSSLKASRCVTGSLSQYFRIFRNRRWCRSLFLRDRRTDSEGLVIGSYWHPLSKES